VLFAIQCDLVSVGLIQSLTLIWFKGYLAFSSFFDDTVVTNALKCVNTLLSGRTKGFEIGFDTEKNLEGEEQDLSEGWSELGESEVSFIFFTTIFCSYRSSSVHNRSISGVQKSL